MSNRFLEVLRHRSVQALKKISYTLMVLPHISIIAIQENGLCLPVSRHLSIVRHLFLIGQLAFFNCFHHLETKQNLMDLFNYGHWMLIVCVSTHHIGSLFPRLVPVDRYRIQRLH